MIHELFPASVADPRTCHNKRASILAAERIIAVSQQTKHDLLRLLPVKESRITVIHHASPFAGDETGNPKLGLPRRYLLFVGARAGYKNFTGFLDAIAPLLAAQSDLYCVCAGGGPFTKAEQRFISERVHTGRILWYAATDENLATLYRQAQAFACPSYYEGFGIPVLEAMTFGCPVLLADRGALPEVGGASARYFDPDEADSIRHAISELLDDAALRVAYAEAGKAHVRQFSWQKCIDAHLSVYRSLQETSSGRSVHPSSVCDRNDSEGGGVYGESVSG
jgi:glycosyltransferase involved in cell wall biosynthesis